MKKLIGLCIVITLIMGINIAGAEEVDMVKITNQWWGYVRDKDFDSFDKSLADGFLGGNQNTTYNAKAFKKVVRNVKISDFKLTDFTVTMKGNVAAVTYYSQVEETIGGKRIEKQKAPRVDVWIKTDKGWKILAHANLNPLGKK